MMGIKHFLPANTLFLPHLNFWKNHAPEMFQLKLHSLLVITVMCRMKPWCGRCDFRPGKGARVSDGVTRMYACLCVPCACFLLQQSDISMPVKAAPWLQSAGPWVWLLTWREEMWVCPGLILFSELHQEVLFLLTGAYSLLELEFSFFC